MAKIIPFCGIRYNQALIKNPQLVVTPPYDTISKEEQSKFYQTSKYNFIRLILGKEEKGDTRDSNKYIRARELLKSWLNKGILVKDALPSIYIYEQTYEIEDKPFRRIGFIALMKLELDSRRVVFPHEKTFCKPKEDRLALLKATKANLSPIFGLYSDRGFKIDRLLEMECSETNPIVDIKFQAVKNRLWKVEDEDTIRQLKKLMLDKKIFIADGHHRYEVACFYHKLSKNSKNTNSGYVMTYFCNLHSKGLKILPTHRVIRNIDADKISALSRYFKMESFSSKDSLFLELRMAKRGEHLFGLCLGRKEFYLLKIQNRKMFPINKSEIGLEIHYNNLDVVLLHNLILSKILRIKEKNTEILYTRDEDLAVRFVEGGKYKAAFFMNPPQAKEVANVASLLRRMPHKSTYFYPKPLSGLVINKLDSN